MIDDARTIEAAHTPNTAVELHAIIRHQCGDCMSALEEDTCAIMLGSNERVGSAATATWGSARWMGMTVHR